MIARNMVGTWNNEAAEHICRYPGEKFSLISIRQVNGMFAYWEQYVKPRYTPQGGQGG